MSLDAIRDLRRSGRKPSMVYVVIGATAAPLDEYGSVVVGPTDDPRFLDWRPLVGLTAAVFTMQPLPQLTIAALEALQAVGVKLFGAADQSGVHPLLEGADEVHEALLQRAWDLLCR